MELSKTGETETKKRERRERKSSLLSPKIDSPINYGAGDSVLLLLLIK
jgi:hypothetical protein